MAQHVPVLPQAFAEAIVTTADGRYVDATFGRGGHARLLLSRLSLHGALLALDRDPAAAAAARLLAGKDERFHFAHAAFAELDTVLERMGWDMVNGIGFDLGVSLPQLTDAARGFSFQQSGPLDMRMDPDSGQPLAARLRDVSEKELRRILREYGGERYAGRIASAILRAVVAGNLNTTGDLEHICFHAVPKGARYGRVHPATRTFQALRMWVNDELGQLQEGLAAAMRHLAPAGRLAVIAFHSIEDRLVRDLIEAEVHPCTCPPDLPVCVCQRKASMRWIHKKPIRPSEAEIAANPKCRSARLRVAERLA